MQFDVHRNKGLAADRAPYLLDLQSDRVRILQLRIVAPLVRPGLFEVLQYLNPVVDVGGEPFVISMAELFAIDRRRLGPVVGELTGERDAIVRALDLLFTGI